MAEPKHKFSRVRRPPAYKIVADELLKAVMERQLRPGDALSVESELAEQFGVNRSTVREGIRHLEQTGLVERQGKRLVVSRPSYSALGDQVGMALLVHDVSFKELWDVKMVLEPLAAGLASEGLTERQLDRLERNLAETRAALEKNENLVPLDLEFHELVAEAANNTALSIARSAIARLFYPAYRVGMFPASSGQRLLAAHEVIVAAIKEKDAAKASDWMRKHIVDFRRGYELAGYDVDAPVPWSD